MGAPNAEPLVVMLKIDPNNEGPSNDLKANAISRSPSLARALQILGENKGIVFFDGDCAMCNGAVHHIVSHDPNAHFYFSSLRGELAATLLPRFGISNPAASETMILLEGRKMFLRSDAAIEIGRRLNLPHQILSLASSVIPTKHPR